MDPAVFPNADQDPDALSMRIRIQLRKRCKKLRYEEFAQVMKKKRLLMLKDKKNMVLVHIYFYFSKFLVESGSMRIRIQSPGHN